MTVQKNVEQRSLLEIIIDLYKKKKKPQKINDLIKEALKIAGYSADEKNLANKVFLDITLSGLFVYVGDGLWDLKTRQDIALYDKDGSYFAKGSKDDEEDDEITADDYKVESDIESTNLEDDDDYSDLDLETIYDDRVNLLDDDELDNEFDTKIPLSNELDDDDDDKLDDDDDDSYIDYPEEDKYETSYDEDDYNDIMDDYESLYDDK